MSWPASVPVSPAAGGKRDDRCRGDRVFGAVCLMFEAIKPLGLLLAGLPVGPDHPGLTAGANFQLPYRASFLLPHRRSAWLRFAERLDELAAFASALDPAAGADVVAAVSEALSGRASELMAHVEAV